MNITNRDYFTFNVDNSVLIAGQTGSGKSELVHMLINRLQSAQSPDEVRFALFDLKQVEFSDTNTDYLYFDVVKDPNVGLEKLDELAKLSVERINNSITKPMIFIYIEECDMAAIDQKIFDNAVITINKNAKKANMKLIYSTSRPSPDVVSKELIASFDLILTGQLASDADAKHLGISIWTQSSPYSFLVTQHSDIYNAEGEHLDTIDISKIDTSFGGDNEPHDDYLSELLKKSYAGEIDCRRATVPMDLIVPFSSFQPVISEDYSNYFIDAYKINNPPDLYVYEKDGKFIMSDDYNAYYMYKSVDANTAVCTVIGESTVTSGVEYGPPFKLQLPVLEVTE